MPQKFTELTRDRNFRMENINKPQSSSKFKILLILGIVFIFIGGTIILLTRNTSKDDNNEINNNDTNNEVEENNEINNEEENNDIENNEIDNNEIENNDIENNDIEEEEEEPVDDSEAVDPPTEANFSQSDQQTGTDGVSGVTINAIEINSYSNFYRITIPVSGTSAPKATVRLSKPTNAIQLKIYGVSSDKSGINTVGFKMDEDSIVNSVYHDTISETGVESYYVGLRADTSFYIHTIEDPLSIVLDVKEIDFTLKEMPEFAMSQSAQTITGNVSSNVISMSKISRSSQPSEGVFRIAFLLASATDSNVPNASASIVDFEGGKAVKLEISNMASDFAGSGNLDQTYGDSAVIGMKGSFSGGKSTYYIKLTSLRDYKLYYLDGPSILLVDVKR